MHVLFLHNNFPAQFGTIGQFLARDGWQVTYFTQRKGAKAQGLDVVVYRDREPKKEHTVDHPFLKSSGKAVVTGLSALEVAQYLKKEKGLRPDVIVAHSGWGPGLFMKDAWPDVPFVGYFEWYYRGQADDIVFLNGPDRPATECARERIRNATILSELTACEAGIVPTAYQASQFPTIFRPKLHVMHDGVDSETYAPGDPGEVTFADQTFRKGDPIVTYVARGMEPYRGFPVFMEAISILQKRHDTVRTIIVGEDRVAYGKAHPSGKSYKEVALQELDLDESRLCFTGLLPRPDYLKVLQISSVHAYLTAPFVLSWSMMEAMSAGCLVLGSDVAPVRELIRDGENGLLTDGQDAHRVADDLERILRGDGAADIRAGARRTILDQYAAKDLWRAKKVFLADVAAGRIAG